MAHPPRRLLRASMATLIAIGRSIAISKYNVTCKATRHDRRAGRPERCMHAGWMQAGRSFFDLPESTPPPAPSEGLGPPKQKTKTNPFLTVTPPLQHARVRRRRNFCGGNPQNDVFTIVFGFSSMCQDTSEDPSSGFWFWTQLCQFRDQDPNFFSTRMASGGLGPWAPSVFCFLFSTLARMFQMPGPPTYREIKNTRPKLPARPHIEIDPPSLEYGGYASKASGPSPNAQQAVPRQMRSSRSALLSADASFCRSCSLATPATSLR